MVGTRGPRDLYVCWILVSVGGMNPREECSSSRGSRGKNSRSRVGSWLCSWAFPAAVHVESSSWDFIFVDTFFESLKGGGEGDVGEVGGLELGLADGKWYRPDGSEECTIAFATWDAPAGMRGTPQ